MNKLKYLLSAFVLLCFASCKDDPWEDVADGGWNHERSIIDVKFEGQAGTPTITETVSETGVIELQLASDMVADMSKVRVETLTLSYKATANVASGGTIDFTKGDPQIVVTSPNGESRTYLALPEHLAPVRYAVSPLLKNKPALVEKARDVYALLKKKYGNVSWDDNGNIGKRYRRQDEIGTPYTVVIDFETIEGDGTVTIRNRDTTEQKRVIIDEI